MKILVIHTAFIGDIVLTTPLIQKIKDIYNAEIDFLTLPANKSIISNNPNIREILLYDKKGKDKGISGFLKILKVLKQKKYDMAIIPHRFIRSIALAKFSGIKKIIGFDVATGSWLLNKKVHYDMNKHEVERLLDLVDYSGERVPVRIYPSKKDKQKIDEILKEKNYYENDKVLNKLELENDKTIRNKLIVIAPGSQRPEKMWEIEKYDEVVEKLAENKNNLIAITGGNAEKSLEMKSIKNENVIDLRGEISLLEFSALLEKSNVVVSNDSSPVHIACGFEKPFIIGIFGRGKRSLGFFPWTEKSIVIEDNEFYENNIVNIPEKQYKYEKDYYKSIKDITVERVYKEILKRL